eukprot:jgi/Undpi1/2065/HiC_scaffold_12.g05451.m1
MPERSRRKGEIRHWQGDMVVEQSLVFSLRQEAAKKPSSRLPDSFAQVMVDIASMVVLEEAAKKPSSRLPDSFAQGIVDSRLNGGARGGRVWHALVRRSDVGGGISHGRQIPRTENLPRLAVRETPPPTSLLLARAC